MSTPTPASAAVNGTIFVRKHADTFADHLKVSAISALIEHNGGPTATANKINELRMPGSKVTPQQRVGAWRARGWASPMAFFELSKMMPPGMTQDDLFRDRLIAEQLCPEPQAQA
jgi:hypothetical protein